MNTTLPGGKSVGSKFGRIHHRPEGLGGSHSHGHEGWPRVRGPIHEHSHVVYSQTTKAEFQVTKVHGPHLPTAVLRLPVDEDGALERKIRVVGLGRVFLGVLEAVNGLVSFVVSLKKRKP